LNAMFSAPCAMQYPKKEDIPMKCTECHTECIDGALFCEECGAKIGNASQLIDAAGALAGEETSLVLASPGGGTLDIPDKDEVVIGREDPISEVFPDVDLTGLGGMENGVSRKHAVIHRSGADYTVEDMGSTNGTYINKMRIQPHVPQAIKAGDEVRFGKLAFSLKAA
jgi:pSer/pThr/pTyr-binding forkhead associated (FHA) protein